MKDIENTKLNFVDLLNRQYFLIETVAMIANHDIGECEGEPSEDYIANQMAILGTVLNRQDDTLLELRSSIGFDCLDFSIAVGILEERKFK